MVGIRKAANRWRPNSERTTCTACSRPFGLLTRRHHCRQCGDIFCADCSVHRRVVPLVHATEPQRVCQKCYRFAADNAALRNNSVNSQVRYPSVSPPPLDVTTGAGVSTNGGSTNYMTATEEMVSDGGVVASGSFYNEKPGSGRSPETDKPQRSSTPRALANNNNNNRVGVSPTNAQNEEPPHATSVLSNERSSSVPAPLDGSEPCHSANGLRDSRFVDGDGCPEEFGAKNDVCRDGREATCDDDVSTRLENEHGNHVGDVSQRSQPAHFSVSEREMNPAAYHQGLGCDYSDDDDDDNLTGTPPSMRPVLPVPESFNEASSSAVGGAALSFMAALEDAQRIRNPTLPVLLYVREGHELPIVTTIDDAEETVGMMVSRLTRKYFELANVRKRPTQEDLDLLEARLHLVNEAGIQIPDDIPVSVLSRKGERAILATKDTIVKAKTTNSTRSLSLQSGFFLRSERSADEDDDSTYLE